MLLDVDQLLLDLDFMLGRFQVAIEFGRKVLESGVRPSFRELEEELKARKGK